MKIFSLKCILPVVILISLIWTPGYPHSGGTDSDGGHYNRKTGQYHYHRKTYKSSPTKRKTYSPRDNRNNERKVEHKDIGEYFRVANEGVGAFDCNITIYDRNVSNKIKRLIRNRDGGCVICGSTYRLEVDHRRALMNGGNNSISNLATLCDDCHTEKTRMDNSIRRKRKKLCRGK